MHSLTGTKLGSTLRFSCDQGFRLVGQSSATCTRNQQSIYQWNAPVPLCQGNPGWTAPPPLLPHPTPPHPPTWPDGRGGSKREQENKRLWKKCCSVS